MTTFQTDSFPRRRWAEMASHEFTRLPRDTVAVLPVAAIEQHGPHLPVMVDACLNEAVVQRTLALLPPGIPVTFLPMQAVGKSNEHLAYAGTLSLSAETLIRLWTEIGECVNRAGIRKLVFFNSHGGQPQVMEIVARDLRARLGMFVVCAASYGFGAPEGLFPETEEKHGIHAGSSETSQMLALRPDLVQMKRADNFSSVTRQFEDEYEYLRAEGPVSFGWQTQDLHPSGACGDASDADAQRGNLALDHSARAFAKLLAEVHHYPLARVVSREVMA